MPDIVFITTSYPKGVSGSEAAGSFVQDFVEEAAKYCRVRVIAPGAREEIERDAIEVYRYHTPERPLSSLNPCKPNDWYHIIATLNSGQRMLEQACSDRRIDHIMALWALPSGFWAQRTHQKRSIPYSIWALGSDIWSLAKIPGVNRILKSVLKSAAYRFADGIELCRDVEKIAGQNCTFLPSVRQLNPPQKPHLALAPPYRLAFLGRWHKNKGIDLLLEALELLDAESWSNIQSLTIAGGGGLEELVKQKVTTLQARNLPLECLGYLDKKAASQLLIDSDYLLLPSRIESIPVIFSDAMHCRCPLIAMPVGDLPLLAEKYRSCLLAESVSAQAYAEAIKEALNRAPAGFSSCFEQAQSDFSVTNSIQSWLELIRL